jgi:cytochrome c2
MDVAGGNAVNARQSVEFVFSSLHDVKVTDYPVFDTAKTEHGGGLGVIDRNRLLLLTGDGEFYLMSLVEGGIEFKAQNIRSPFDKSRYRASVEQPSPYFRVMDLLVADGTGNPRSVFVSYHHWDEPQQCVTLKVAEASIDFDRLGATELQWHVRFTSTPCVPHDRMNNGTGGRMALLPPSTLLVTVGETVHEMTDLARDDSVSYGKIMAVDRRDWSARVFSKGHRNPQGLLVDGDTIWSTEHGPHGGDELNVIVEGEDYGWPDATYGTEYGQKTWPRSSTPGDHSAGHRPVYAWVPSIAVSEVIRMRGPAFPSWRGDLLVSSLSGLGNGYSLYRVRIHDGRVQVVERIRTALLVRDLVEGPDGRIVMWDGLRTIQIVESANHIFTPCAGCHALRRLNHGIGPDLWNIVGRAVASHREFQYSAALRDFGGRWSRDRLDAFLRAPAEAVPGTSMDIPGIEDADERRAIIEYLEKLPD